MDIQVYPSVKVHGRRALVQLQDRLYLGHFITADWLAKSVCHLSAASRPRIFM